ncbi:MAG: hypothetical protein D9C04_00500 [Nitrosopumilus sp. B06]|nr:MAG: hypothetical protein EB828_04295 [Nitrosopumilus sp. D6]RNJ80670.1 MAG: hypothetical protein D9C04_00500 [Nitrosopumilus sp. B06]
MGESFDRDRIVDCMFDPVTSLILAELEDGKKECSYLAQKASIPESKVLERLSYLIECGFVIRSGSPDTFAADSEKLNSVVEDGANFDAAVSGLEKMDSYLN